MSILWAVWNRMLLRRKPRILLVPDQPDWAFDFLARDLIRATSARYEFTKHFARELPTDEDYDRFDAVFFFWWGNRSIASARQFNIPSQRLITAVSSHKSFDRPGWTSAHLGRRLGFYAAVGTPSVSLYDVIAGVHPYPYLTRHGIDPRRFDQRTAIPAERPEGRLVVGWAGSLRHAAFKGVPNFIEPAVAAIEGVELHLALGAGSEHPAGRHYPRSAMAEFYNDIDVYLCASESEGANLCLLEAGACGRPVITTPVGVAPELVRHGKNGLIVERSVESLVEALRRLRADRRLLRELGGELKADVHRDWTWSTRAREYTRMFDAVIGRSKFGRLRHQARSNRKLTTESRPGAMPEGGP